jgi:hypothetical protein
MLRDRLPIAFSFLDTHPRHHNRLYQAGSDHSKKKYLPPYLLCQKTSHSISVVPQRTYPTGHDIQVYSKSLNRGPATENVLIFGTLLLFVAETMADNLIL